MSTNRALTVASVALGVSAFACAGPSFEEAAARSLEAIGSPAGGHTVRSVRTTASGLSANGAYAMTVEASADLSMVRFVYQRDGGEPYRLLVNGSTAHVLDESGEPIEEAGRFSAFFARGHAFHAMVLSPESYFLDASSAGEHRFGAAQCHAFDARTPVGEPITAYFDSGTGLLCGLEFDDPAPNAEEGSTVRVRFIEWQDVDGLLLPRVILALDSGGSYVLEYREVDLMRE